MNKRLVITLVILAVLALVWSLWITGGNLQDLIPLARENNWNIIQWSLDTL